MISYICDYRNSLSAKAQEAFNDRWGFHTLYLKRPSGRSGSGGSSSRSSGGGGGSNNSLTRMCEDV